MFDSALVKYRRAVVMLETSTAWHSAGKQHHHDSEFAHIDYEEMVHRHCLHVSHAKCAATGPKTMLSASTCRRILEEALSLLSYHLGEGHPLQVHSGNLDTSAAYDPLSLTSYHCQAQEHGLLLGLAADHDQSQSLGI